jgi:hypothetical protein
MGCTGGQHRSVYMVEMLARRFDGRMPHCCATANSTPRMKRRRCPPHAAARPLPDPLPLFPLRTVLFPGALLGLKIFEARYLDLVSECLRTQQPFGVICLRRAARPGRGCDASSSRWACWRTSTRSTAEQPGILRLRCHGGSASAWRGRRPARQRPVGGSRST